MKTRKNCVKFLVLVPHRDARLPLKSWSGSLFNAGFPGAWSFPWVVPLAMLGRSLSSEELKSLARALRVFLNSGDGKFAGSLPVSATLPALGNGEAVFGPELNIKLPVDFFETVFDALSCRISPLVLGSALVHDTAEPPLVGLPAPLPISFRAAALANMRCRFESFDTNSNSGFSFEWKIGKLHWLPKK